MEKMTIRQVSEATGIPSHTLRFWEKEFVGILEPARTEGDRGCESFIPESPIGKQTCGKR